MKKKHLIVSFLILFGLIIGIYQYFQFFQAEIAGATDTTKKANGHFWSEMECNSGLCVTQDDKVGIGTANPSEKLSVGGNVNATGNISADGKIIMKQETVSTDSSNTLVTKGYLSSANSPVIKVISGVGATCPVGTSLLMKCIGTPYCAWYNGTDASHTGTTVEVMCGGKVTLDGTPMLVYEQHTQGQCKSASVGGVSGQVVSDGSGHNMCRFNAASCPSSWTMYDGWSTTISTPCGGEDCPMDAPQCTPVVHSWGNDGSIKTCSFIDYGGLQQGHQNTEWKCKGSLLFDDFQNYCCGYPSVCSATRTQIGCY